MDAKLVAIEAGQTRMDAKLVAIEAGQITTRTELMERMNRLQERLGHLDQHLTIGLGYSDEVAASNRDFHERSRLIGEQVRTLQALVRKLESRVNQLEDRS